MTDQPEQVLNIKTGQYENCHVGEGCRLHVHPDELKRKMTKTRDSLSISSDHENNWMIAKVMAPVGGAVTGLAAMGAMSLPGLLAVPLMPALGIIGIATVAGGILTAVGFMLYSAIRKKIDKQKLKKLEAQELLAKQKEDAEDDITSIAEYENPNL